MKKLIVSLTQLGQVTIPAEVRRILGIRPKDKVVFLNEGDQVTLAPAQFTLETAYGSVGPMRRPEDFKEITRQAKEEHADRAFRKLHKR